MNLFQNRLLLMFCFIALSHAAEKQIKLEDIEKDNLAAERRTKHRMQPRMHLLNIQYDTRPQQFSQASQVPSSPAPAQYHSPPKTQHVHYLSVNYQKPPYAAPQQYIQPADKYTQYSQPSYQIQYVAPPTHPSPPQSYIFIQPITADSNQMAKLAHQKNIQFFMVLDPNSHYLKNPHVQASLLKEDAHQHNLAGLLQRNAYTNSIPQNYRPPTQQPQIQQPSSSQQTFGFQHPMYFLPQNQPYQFMVPSYVGKQQRGYEQQGAASITSLSVVPKRQPTSLLDSYIPSVLQIQYLKHLQESASNTVPQIVKFEDGKRETFVGFDHEK